MLKYYNSMSLHVDNVERLRTVKILVNIIKPNTVVELDNRLYWKQCNKGLVHKVNRYVHKTSIRLK